MYYTLMNVQMSISKDVKDGVQHITFLIVLH